MSRRVGFKLTPTAKADLLEIAEFSRSNWGVTQRDKYLGELYECFEILTDNPELGRDRSEVKPGYRSLSKGSHVIFYRIQPNSIEIIGIPHASKDLDKLLTDENQQDDPSAA